MTTEPMLFSTDAGLLAKVARSDVPAEQPAAVVVDWEHRGKDERQASSSEHIGIDTDLHSDTAADLTRVRATVDIPVICRVNAVSRTTADEVDLAIESGADEILVPMLRSAAELEVVLDAVDGRVGTGVMVETVAAVQHIRVLAGYPIVRAYIGLMDLALDRRTPSVFTALVDGTVDEVVSHLDGVPFGVGGLTLPNHGHPVPARLLAGELVRLGSSFSFLRRSFLADLGDREPGPAIVAIRRMLAELDDRVPEHVAADRREFVARVAGLERVTV